MQEFDRDSETYTEALILVKNNGEGSLQPKFVTGLSYKKKTREALGKV
jgi:hypothetical protein